MRESNIVSSTVLEYSFEVLVFPLPSPAGKVLLQLYTSAPLQLLLILDTLVSFFWSYFTQVKI